MFSELKKIPERKQGKHTLTEGRSSQRLFFLCAVMVEECRMPLNVILSYLIYSELTRLILQNMVKNGVNKNYEKNTQSSQVLLKSN